MPPLYAGAVHKITILLVVEDIFNGIPGAFGIEAALIFLD